MQVEEKTVATTMTTSATRQEQRVVTQEVRATSTVLANDSQVWCTYQSAGSKIRTDFQLEGPPHRQGTSILDIRN